jgi:hypothetical protein
VLPRTTPTGPFPIQHAFVVQFAAETTLDATGITGRVEHLVSGQATRFQSVAALFAFIGSSPPTPSVRSQLSHCIHRPRRSDWSFFFVDTCVPEREKTLGSVMSALCSKRARASRGVGRQ